MPWADRFQPQPIGESDPDRRRGDVPKSTIAVAAALHHQVEIVQPDPGRRVVFAWLQPGPGEVTVDVDEEVDLPPKDAIVRPHPVRDHGLDAPQRPACFLLDFTGQRLLWWFASFDMTSDDIPYCREHPPVRTSTMDVNLIPMVTDEGTHADVFRRAATILILEGGTTSGAGLVSHQIGEHSSHRFVHVRFGTATSLSGPCVCGDYGSNRFGPRKRNVDSRMLSSPSSTIMIRFNPAPSPPCGGVPNRNESR